MPPNVTEANATSKRKCFAHHHLTIEEYGLWTHACEVSAESRVFYFDGRAVAARFCDQGKDTVYRIAAGLARKGFFHVLKKSKREKKTGLFKPTQYQPLSFGEWKEKHPARYAACKVCTPSLNSGLEPFLNSRLEPVLKTRLEEPSPVWNSRTTSLENENDLSGNPDIILIKNIIEKEKESKNTSRAQGARTAAPVGLATRPEMQPRVSEKRLDKVIGKHTAARFLEIFFASERTVELREFLQENFAVSAAAHLTFRQYRAALEFIEHGIPLPKVH